MNDVERVDEYSTQLPLELYEGSEPPADWPNGGEIVFRDVRLQYASARLPVFESLTFTVPPRTCVGVVGRLRRLFPRKRKSQVGMR